jgi:hypothetical protein
VHDEVRHLGQRRSYREVDGTRGQQTRQLLGLPHAELDVQVVGSSGEELDQPRGGVLGEQARGGQSQQPPTVAGLADLAHGAVLQPEDLHGTAGQPQPAGGEGQP